MQEQPEDLLGPSRNQSIDKPGPQESINMDGKSQETMHMHYNLIYTMATTRGRKLLIEQIKEYQVFTDVGNAYLQALTREKLNIVSGPEFEELQGHVLVMYKALYGTRSGGACWHDKFFDILHHMGFKTSEVDWGGHDPNPNHVNESLLSEVDWGAHNPDADDPEQLIGESIQSFLTFVVQLQWLVALGRLYLHKSLPCPSLW